MSKLHTASRENGGPSRITAAHALALGALAADAAAIGVFAVGALAIGRLRVLEGRIEKLSIGTLTVEHMNVVSHTPTNDGRPDYMLVAAD